MISSQAVAIGFGLIFLFGSATGCVLTDSQLAEVKKFSTASQGYADVASEPIRQYGQLLVTPRLYDTTILDFNNTEDLKVAKDAFDAVKSDRDKFAALAKKLKGHLGVLDKYSEALTALTSEDLSKEVTKSAEDLGKAIDKDIKAVNGIRKAQGQAELSLIGEAVSSAVSTIGGWYLKVRQTELTKAYVDKMEPNISLIFEVIENEYSPKVCGQQKDLSKRIWEGFKKRAQASKIPSYSDTRAAFDGITAVSDAYALCTSVVENTIAYKGAHTALQTKLKDKVDLKEAIKEVSDFGKGMKALKDDYKTITAIDKK